MTSQDSCSPINLTGDTIGESWHKGLTNVLPQKRKNKATDEMKGPVSLIPKNVRSEVYKYFEDLNYLNKLKCKLCSKPVNYTGKNTSGMISHMKNCALIREAEAKQNLKNLKGGGIKAYLRDYSSTQALGFSVFGGKQETKRANE
eukprot:snap_masked-scaffold_1-processed-gene-14.11-mRNA-1 protein AED:1.00 eAED:1.00 QI:0/-1/0/0/-1/1/1/0/144